MNNNNLFKKVLMLTICFIISMSGLNTAYSQPTGMLDDEFPITIGSETYVPLTTANLPWTNSSDDGNYSLGPIPFNIRFDTTNYPAGTSWYFGTNGYLSFAVQSNSILSGNTFIPVSYPMIHFLAIDCGNMESYGGGVKVATLGSTPNRRFVIEAKGIGHYYSSNRDGIAGIVQMIFYENSEYPAYPNKCRIHFGPSAGYAYNSTGPYWAGVIGSGSSVNRLLHFKVDASSNLSVLKTNSGDTRSANTTITCGTGGGNFMSGYMVHGQYIDLGLESYGPAIAGLTPPNDTIFAADPFVGDIFTPSVQFKRKTDQPSIELQYIIRDNAGNIVFMALDPNNPSSDWIQIPTSLSNDTDPITYSFAKARGTQVDSSTNPCRLNFRSASVRGGYYTVEARLRYKDDRTNEIKYSEKTSTFEVLFNLDIAIVEVKEPRSALTTEFIYPLVNAPIRFQTNFKNVGKNVFRNFDIRYRVSKIVEDTITKNPLRIDTTYQLVYDRTIPIRMVSDMVKDQEYLHEISDFNPVTNTLVGILKPGTYRLDVDVSLYNMSEVPLLDNHIEQIFKMDYPYDGAVRSVEFPVATSDTSVPALHRILYVDQPYFAKFVVANNSAFSASAVPLRVTITKIGASAPVYDNIELIEDLPSGGTNVVYEFYNPFIIKEPGTYQLRVEIDTTDDYNRTNNEAILIFSVADGMSGQYKIGYNDLDPQFSTIEEALNELYIRGVKDTVTFVLTDASYTVGSLSQDYALNLSSAIAGFNNKKLIRFVPSEELRYIRNSISINLLSRTGIGMYFASSLTNSQFIGAPGNRLYRSLSSLAGERQRDYYGFNAKFEIDGGSNQSIRIALAPNVTGSNRIPIMMAQGANNITIKNCILEGVSLPKAQVPSVLYDAKWNTFTYSGVSGVSSVILLRNVLPVDHNGINSNSLDTILINNINIDRNHIENGSFGIMSIGLGPLYDVRAGYYVGYYNNNNRFSNNQMSSFDVAGIFLGYERNSKVLNNTIYVVGLSNTESVDAAGIMMGGFGEERTSDVPGKTGYNNLNITIEGNEISKIYSNKDSYGIKIEQEFNNFVYSQVPGEKYFANHNDSMSIFNNVIWAIQTTPTNFDGSRYGIRLFGSRTFHPANRFGEFTTRRDSNYTISHTRIINNSIVLNEDDNRKINNDRAYIGGIVLQDIDTLMMYNNAVEILDNTNISDVVAAVVIQSVRPNTSGTKFSADNNIYYTPDMSVIRFIEQSSREKSLLLNPGARNQFVGLEQWVFLTNTEVTTAYTNFYSDLYVTKTNPQSLRITSPVPIGSYLNNRGKKFDFITTDIYGILRGQTDQDYDIGAWEFTGRAYENDCGILNFVTPVSARDYSHPIFNESEYVMTTAPVDVIVNVRNNGSNAIRNKEITLQVYQINDVTNAETLIGTYRTVVNAASSETKAIDFAISKMDTLVFPKTYSELGIAAPERFRKMVNNVTPRYRFKVTLPSDQDTKNDTNAPQKIVRYYLKKSNISTLISVDNTTLIPPAFDTLDYTKWIGDNYPVANATDMSKVGGYLNFKALEKGLKDLGFKYQVDGGYDIMDRSVWEPNSINYSTYRYMLWADAINDKFTEVQERDIDNFMNGATHIGNHKNLIFSSEEIARNSYTYYVSIDESDFVKKLFGTTPKGSGIFNVTYEPNTNNNSVLITGNTLLPNANAIIKNTSLVSLNPAKDVRMQPAVFESYGNGKLSTVQAMYYTKLTAMSKAEKTFGLISFAPESNAIYLGVDWRNYEDPSIILSAILNHIGGFNEDQIVLPIELIGFEANVVNNKVILTWETASEVRTSKFVVEKLNNNNFAAISETAAKGSNAFSNLYSTIDENVECGNTYTYRLKSVDLDGSYSYSNEKSVSIDAAANFVSLDKPTPNPATDAITISFALSNEANVKLSILDVTGKEAMVLIANQSIKGNNKLSFSISDLASGSYNLILNANGNIVSQSFNVAK